jgi:nitrous oxide reductase accessory protein NosL
MVSIGRRAFGSVVAAWAVTSCRSAPKEERCALCGMIIDPASSWRADLVLADGSTKHYDTPRCAFTAWRSGAAAAVSLRVLDYYDRRWREGSDVLFVVGSDVPGPMGPDLVPVDPARAAKFAQDHGAGRPLGIAAVTSELLSELR